MSKLTAEEKLQIRDFQSALQTFENQSLQLAVQYFNQNNAIKQQAELKSEEFKKFMHGINKTYGCDICTQNFECIEASGPCAEPPLPITETLPTELTANERQNQQGQI